MKRQPFENFTVRNYDPHPKDELFDFFIFEFIFTYFYSTYLNIQNI